MVGLMIVLGLYGGGFLLFLWLFRRTDSVALWLRWFHVSAMAFCGWRFVLNVVHFAKKYGLKKG